MRAIFLVALASYAALAEPVYATGEISCHGPEGVGVDLLVGHLDYLYIDRVILTVGDRTWSSQPVTMPGLPVRVVHVFEDQYQMLVDFSGDEAEKIASLRVFKLTETDTTKAGGVFSLRGEGVWVVDCSEPG